MSYELDRNVNINALKIIFICGKDLFHKLKKVLFDVAFKNPHYLQQLQYILN